MLMGEGLGSGVWDWGVQDFEFLISVQGLEFLGSGFEFRLSV